MLGFDQDNKTLLNTLASTHTIALEGTDNAWSRTWLRKQQTLYDRASRAVKNSRARHDTTVSRLTSGYLLLEVSSLSGSTQTKRNRKHSAKSGAMTLDATPTTPFGFVINKGGLIHRCCSQGVFGRRFSAVDHGSGWNDQDSTSETSWPDDTASWDSGAWSADGVSDII